MLGDNWKFGEIGVWKDDRDGVQFEREYVGVWREGDDELAELLLDWQGFLLWAHEVVGSMRKIQVVAHRPK